MEHRKEDPNADTGRFIKETLIMKIAITANQQVSKARSGLTCSANSFPLAHSADTTQHVDPLGVLFLPTH